MERFPKPRKQILKQQWLSQNRKSSLMWSKRKILSLSSFRVFTELRQKSSIKNYWVTLDWEVDVSFFFSYVSRKDCDIIRKLAVSVLLPRLTEMRTTPETPRKQHQQEVGFMRTARNQPTVSELWTHACQSNTQVIPCDAWQQTSNKKPRENGDWINCVLTLSPVCWETNKLCFQISKQRVWKDRSNKYLVKGQLCKHVLDGSVKPLGRVI